MSGKPLQILAMTARISLLAVVLVPALSAAATARGASQSSPWLQALSNSFTVIDMAEGDLDGDGKKETVVCYQESADNPTDDGGVAILKRRGRTLEPAYHVRLDQAWCEEVKVQGNRVGFLLRSRTLDKKRGKLVWTYGEDFSFVGSGDHFLDKSTIETTSSTGGVYNGKAAVDGNTETSWAEGAKGTGIGESLTIKLPRAMDVSYVAIYGGHGGGQRPFFDHNRVHRGSVEARTEADLGDALAGIDFSELGIGAGGDRIEFSLENRPGVTYVRVDKKAVTEVNVRIDSVFLGRRTDDTHIAEIEVVPMLQLSETLDRAKPLSQKTPQKRDADKASADKRGDKKKSEKRAAARKSKEDEALKRLENEGRGLDVDSDW